MAIRKTLVEREPARADLQCDLAISYERMATIDPTRAPTWLRDAIAVHRRRLATDAGNVRIQRELAIVLVQLGQALGIQGDHAHALEHLREAHALLRPLHDRGALESRYHALVDRLAQLSG